jgi:hypothetical protein
MLVRGCSTTYTVWAGVANNVPSRSSGSNRTARCSTKDYFPKVAERIEHENFDKPTPNNHVDGSRQHKVMPISL